MSEIYQQLEGGDSQTAVKHISSTSQVTLCPSEGKGLQSSSTLWDHAHIPQRLKNTYGDHQAGLTREPFTKVITSSASVVGSDLVERLILRQQKDTKYNGVLINFETLQTQANSIRVQQPLKRSHGGSLWPQLQPRRTVMKTGEHPTTKFKADGQSHACADSLSILSSAAESSMCGRESTVDHTTRIIKQQDVGENRSLQPQKPAAAATDPALTTTTTATSDPSAYANAAGSAEAGGTAGSAEAGGTAGSAGAGGTAGSAEAGGTAGSAEAGGTAGSAEAGGTAGEGGAAEKLCNLQESLITPSRIYQLPFEPVTSVHSLRPQAPQSVKDTALGKNLVFKGLGSKSMTVQPIQSSEAQKVTTLPWLFTKDSRNKPKSSLHRSVADIAFPSKGCPETGDSLNVSKHSTIEISLPPLVGSPKGEVQSLKVVRREMHRLSLHQADLLSQSRGQCILKLYGRHGSTFRSQQRSDARVEYMATRLPSVAARLPQLPLKWYCQPEIGVLQEVASDSCEVFDTTMHTESQTTTPASRASPLPLLFAPTSPTADMLHHTQKLIPVIHVGDTDDHLLNILERNRESCYHAHLPDELCEPSLNSYLSQLSFLVKEGTEAQIRTQPANAGTLTDDSMSAFVEQQTLQENTPVTGKETPSPSVPATVEEVTPSPSVPATVEEVTPSPSVPATVEEVTPSPSVPITVEEVTPSPSVPATVEEVTPSPSVPLTVEEV
ncbi:hypothetical protein CEUSTIGMA_g4689.t1, partial [Chlamydomonas eustigma]